MKKPIRCLIKLLDPCPISRIYKKEYKGGRISLEEYKECRSIGYMLDGVCDVKYLIYYGAGRILFR